MMRESLKIDKGAAAKRVASLENKGYLIRKHNPEDGRSQLLYATPKAEELKNSKAQIETIFYEWLLSELPEEEKEAFCKTLDTPVSYTHLDVYKRQSLYGCDPPLLFQCSGRDVYRTEKL